MNTLLPTVRSDTQGLKSTVISFGHSPNAASPSVSIPGGQLTLSSDAHLKNALLPIVRSEAHALKSADMRFWHCPKAPLPSSSSPGGQQTLSSEVHFMNAPPPILRSDAHLLKSIDCSLRQFANAKERIFRRLPGSCTVS
eukprot:CAMPEP_0174847484 /NCGR_PEP_ID=MMETSP1114-20130205/12939_1 /TAXON_ID=312471 /ORGANISM="Neobodo designis, Strain CCAP 1951/1" /LENGTH=139 /DNA_ID=CAMNT_0016081763 /DNA_START=454 /DNA_END=869 /DNA_ORIENTATION=+